MITTDIIQCKAMYEKACSDADKSSEVLQQNMTQPSKKVDELKAKMKHAQVAAENAGMYIARCTMYNVHPAPN